MRAHMPVRSALLVLVGGLSVAYALDLYVATDGDDGNPGTRDAPFAAIGRAQSALRAMKRTARQPDDGVTVWLRGGTYVLDDPLAFTANDSGTSEAPVTIRAVQGEDVWISGGSTVSPGLFARVTDAEVLARLPVDAREHVRQVGLADAGIDDYVREVPDKFSGFTRVDVPFVQVFCNGRQMQWARWPNQGFATFAEIIDTGSGLRDYKAQQTKEFRPGVFSYTGNRPERWDVERGVWMMGFWARAYVCDVVRAGSIDTKNKQITWKVPLRFGLDTWGANRWYAFNLMEELDMPGEWYIDRENGVLYFWPPEPIEGASVMLTRMKEPLLTVRDAEHITIRGIGFEGGRGDAVVIRDGRNVQVIGCEIRNVGRHAVQVLGGSDHQVIGCDIHHVGYSGVILSGGNRKTLEPAGFQAVNNHIHHTNTIRRTHASPVKMHGVGMRLAHNLIHHAPHSAVFYGGNDLIMEYNDIYWCHYETAEGGVFYTGYNWTFRGNEIRYNYIHHINDSLAGSPTGVNVLHLDDCVAGTTFRGNVVYRVGRGVSMCGGPFNVVDNNLFIDCQVGASLSNRGQAWWTWTRHADGTVTARDTRASHGYSTNNGLLTKLDQVPWQGEAYAKYPHMAELLSVPDEDIGAPLWNGITRNISINGPVMRVPKNLKPHWVTIADNWNGPDDADPGVVAPYAGDFRLKPDAPATPIGFDPIPFETIGLFKDDSRRSWPPDATPPPEDFRPAWLLQREMEKRMPCGLPVVAVHRAAGVIRVDGSVEPDEWTPDQQQAVRANRHVPEKLRWEAAGGAAKTPSDAYLQVDDQNLYAGFVNDVAGAIVGGHTWGQSDAVEIALAVVDGLEVGPIMIWRGYTDGHWETSDEAGAPRAVSERTRAGVKYACSIASPRRWTAEFSIPFEAIGIDPHATNPRLLFSLAVRKVDADEWVTWKKTTGASWDVRRSGMLWLEPFGDITFNGAVPSWARCEIFARSDNLRIEPGRGVDLLTWAKPVGTRLRARSVELDTQWRDFTFTFIPSIDGDVELQLRGRPQTSAVKNDTYLPVWTYWDNLHVTGATIANGDFEMPAKDGPTPEGWRTSSRAVWMTHPDIAGSGTACVKTWFLGSVSQTLRVTANQPVTVRCRIRGEAVIQR